MAERDGLRVRHLTQNVVQVKPDGCAYFWNVPSHVSRPQSAVGDRN